MKQPTVDEVLDYVAWAILCALLLGLVVLACRGDTGAQGVLIWGSVVFSAWRLLIRRIT
jgi:hypothetical protein